MSNFTTFFPSGGSGGGGINSYAPFKVSSTGNPAGYNSTTGLYTNPIDNSVWLKNRRYNRRWCRKLSICNKSNRLEFYSACLFKQYGYWYKPHSKDDFRNCL